MLLLFMVLFCCRCYSCFAFFVNETRCWPRLYRRATPLTVMVLHHFEINCARDTCGHSYCVFCFTISKPWFKAWFDLSIPEWTLAKWAVSPISDLSWWKTTPVNIEWTMKINMSDGSFISLEINAWKYWSPPVCMGYNISFQGRWDYR